MTKINNLLFVFLVLIALSFSVEASLQTGNLSPPSADLCSSYPDILTLTATNITNDADNLTNVRATLMITPNNGGLSILTNTAVLLGSIPFSTQSLINPSWSIQCNPNFPGSYKLYIDYIADNYSESSENQIFSTFTVHSDDVLSPSILTHSPSSKIINPYTTLEVTTNTDAVCKFSKIQSIDYDNMVSTFSITGGTIHKEVIKGLIDNQYYYYVRCMDTNGNKATEDYKISFDVDVPPTAQISLDKSSPLKEGTIKVTLTTSEEVKPIPSLYYSFDNGAKINIPLGGSGTSWEGYMILQYNNNNKVGSFGFSGTDLTGNIGTVITSGNIFIIDTISPEVPTQFTATERRDGSIKLNWQHNEEISHYNIYKSAGIEDSSFYKKVTGKGFIDYSTIPGETYFYIISAVDLAGNEGDFSNEISITAGQNTGYVSSYTTPPQKNQEEINETDLLKKIKQAGDSVDNLLDDISDIKSGFSKYSQEEFNLLEIKETLNEKKFELLKLKDDLGELKSKTSDRNTLNKLSGFIAGIEEIKNETPKKVRYEKRLNFDLILSEKEISEVLDTFLQIEKISVSEKDKKKYIVKIKKFQQDLEVSIEINKLVIVYLDDQEEEIVLVDKEIVFDESQDIVLVEFFPEDIFPNMENIVFKSSEFTKKDQTLKTTPKIVDNLKIKYLIRDDLLLEDTKKIKTLILPDFDKFDNEQGGNEITGFSISTVMEDASFYDIGIAIGIVLIIMLAFCSLIYKRKKKNIFSLISKKITPRKINSIKSRIKNLLSLFKKLIKKRFKLTERHNTFYSIHTTKSNLKNSSTKLENGELNTLIKKINKYLNRLNYNRALKFYCILKANYESIPSKKRSKEIKRNINRLQKKIDLLMKINLLPPCFEQKNFSKLKHLLNDIAKNYNQLIKETRGEETKFFDYVRLYHNNLSQTLLK